MRKIVQVLDSNKNNVIDIFFTPILLNCNLIEFLTTLQNFNK